MTKRVCALRPFLMSALLWGAGATALAQNPQARPAQPGTGTGISGDSAASVPLSSIKKDPAYGKFKTDRLGRGGKNIKSDTGSEPSDPHQVNGKASGGPDNKASQPEPGGRGNGLSR